MKNDNLFDIMANALNPKLLQEMEEKAAPKKVIVSVKKWTIKDKFYCTNCGKQVKYPEYTCTPCNIKIQPVVNF